jgi:hypothetical protein
MSFVPPFNKQRMGVSLIEEHPSPIFPDKSENRVVMISGS